MNRSLELLAAAALAGVVWLALTAIAAVTVWRLRGETTIARAAGLALAIGIALLVGLLRLPHPGDWHGD